MDTTPSTASHRESAVRNSINTATSKLFDSGRFSKESLSAYLLSPVLGTKAALLTHASQQRRQGASFLERKHHEHNQLLLRNIIIISAVLIACRSFAWVEPERIAS